MNAARLTIGGVAHLSLSSRGNPGPGAPRPSPKDNPQYADRATKTQLEPSSADLRPETVSSPPPAGRHSPADRARAAAQATHTGTMRPSLALRGAGRGGGASVVRLAACANPRGASPDAQAELAAYPTHSGLRRAGRTPKHKM